jgi:hypothetical protein
MLVSEHVNKRCVSKQRTTKIPMLKSILSPIFCFIGRVIDATMGIGTAIMERSVLILKIA